MINSGNVFCQAQAGIYPRLTSPLAPRYRSEHSRLIARSNTNSTSDIETLRDVRDLQDPEESLRKLSMASFSFGPSFLQNWFDTAPRIRVRRADDRAKDQLADLAVINERLAQKTNIDTTAARQRLEYLKRRRKNWEMVYQYITKEDVLCTLSAIEQANQKVEELLSEEARENATVGDLKLQLQQLQKEIADAHAALHATQSRVDSNLQRLTELKQEAAKFESLHKSMASIAAAGTDLATADLESITAAAVTTTTDSSSMSSTSSSSTTTTTTTTSNTNNNNNKRPRRPLSRQDRGLNSTMDLEDELKNHWFPVHFSSKLQHDTLLPFELFNEPWVLFRDAQGRAACVRDECAHRACPLSLGAVVDGEVQCAYHGWQFNGAGDCTVMPSTKFCRGVRVSALPVAEEDGLIFVWPGWREADPLPSGMVSPPPGYQIHAEIEMEVPVEHGLLVENLLDLAHAPFTHTTTFAKGWPVPDAVQFHAARMLSGTWQPYPIDMEFRPPCVTVSTIGLAQPGKIERNVVAADCENHLHQVHVCLPAKRGHTRLLYRMSMDFLGWTRYIPGIQEFWKSIAAQVLGEDLVLVEGQQDRMQRGGDTWAHPVSYDKLAVRYRRWRNAVATGGSNSTSGVVSGSESEQEDAATGAVSGSSSARLGMNAGELFSIDEDEVGVYVDTMVE